MKQPEVIVSLTSFPAAIEFARGAIESVLAGSVLPDRLVLYVTLSQFGEDGLPQDLIALEKENPIFEIRDYPTDIRSYRKLVPALKDFADDIIVTIDDDVAYHPHLLRDLLKYHKLYPDDIIAHRAKKIRYPLPYRKWRKFRWYHFLGKKVHRNFSTIQTGVGGVLYPPHSLRMDMIDEQLFTSLAPTADDIWFWAAAVANGRMVLPVPFGRNKPKGLGKPKSLSLKTVNFKNGTDRNSESLNNILQKFPDLQQCLKETSM